MVLVAVYGSTFRLPHYFAYSDSVILAGLNIALVLAVSMMLPDRWLHTDAVLLRHAFQQRHGIGDVRAENVLTAIAELHAKAVRLAKAEEALVPELQGRVAEARHILDGISRLFFYEPDRLQVFRAVSIRSESVVEAVEAQAKLRKTKASQEQLGEARQRVISALDVLMEALEAIEERRITSLLDNIHGASATAEALLKTSSHKKGLMV